MITQGSHLPAALASPLVEVAALVDPAIERAAALAKGYGISPRVTARVEDALEGMDGAVIATPNDSHRALALACLERRVPVLIEKPLASTHRDGEDIVRAGEALGLAVAVGYSTRFRGNILLLKDLLDSGYFGKVLRFAHQFGTPGGWAPLSAYNLDRKTAGGGVLVVTGTHFLDRMLYLWGYPQDARLEDDALDGPEPNCVARFRYDGAAGAFEGVARYSKTGKLPAGLVIETDRGYVVVGDGDNSDILFRERARPDLEQVVRRRSNPAGQSRRSVTQLQLEDFVAACRDGRKPMVDGVQGLESLRLIEQLYAARKTVDMDWYENAGSRVQI